MKKKKMYKAILFDFDYTLADATKGIVGSFQYAFSKMGLPQRDTEAIRRTIGLPIPDSYMSLTGDTDEGHAKDFFAHFLESADKIMAKNTVLYPDVLQILNQLHSTGIKTGIVTTKYRYRIIDVFKLLKMNPPVDIIVGYEDVKTVKPSPEGLLYAMEQLEVGKDETLYIGDNTVDAGAASEADVDFAAVLTGTTGKEAFQPYPCLCCEQNIGTLMRRIIHDEPRMDTDEF